MSFDIESTCEENIWGIKPFKVLSFLHNKNLMLLKLKFEVRIFLGGPNRECKKENKKSSNLSRRP